MDNFEIKPLFHTSTLSTMCLLSSLLSFHLHTVIPSQLLCTISPFFRHFFLTSSGVSFLFERNVPQMYVL